MLSLKWGVWCCLMAQALGSELLMWSSALHSLSGLGEVNHPAWASASSPAKQGNNGTTVKTQWSWPPPCTFQFSRWRLLAGHQDSLMPPHPPGKVSPQLSLETRDESLPHLCPSPSRCYIWVSLNSLCFYPSETHTETELVIFSGLFLLIL